MLLLSKLSGCWQFALANILRSTEHLQGVGCRLQQAVALAKVCIVTGKGVDSQFSYMYILYIRISTTKHLCRNSETSCGKRKSVEWAIGNRFCLAKPFNISSGVKFKYSKFSPRCCIEFANRKVQVATISPSHLSAEFFCLKYCKDICKLLLSLYSGIPACQDWTSCSISKSTKTITVVCSILLFKTIFFILRIMNMKNKRKKKIFW